MPLSKGETWRIEFGAIGAPELYAVLSDPQVRPAGEQRLIQRAQFTTYRIARGSLRPDASDDWAIDALDKFAAQLLVEWNIVDEDTKQVVPIFDAEGKRNPDPFLMIHGDVYRELLREVNERLNAPPKRSRG